MNKLTFGTGLLAVFITVASMSTAYAISEKYRQQLEQSGKTQMDELAEPVHPNTPNMSKGLTTYSDSMLEVQADSSCQVKKVNGFAPKHIKHVKKNMDEVQTQMGVTLSVLYTGTGCDITWTNKQEQSGILKAQ